MAHLHPRPIYKKYYKRKSTQSHNYKYCIKAHTVYYYYSRSYHFHGPDHYSIRTGCLALPLGAPYDPTAAPPSFAAQASSPRFPSRQAYRTTSPNRAMPPA